MPELEVATICPGFVMGPPICAEPGASMTWVKNVMTGAMKEVGSGSLAFVDVREVAQAHLLAIKKPAAKGKRFILAQSTPRYHEYARPIVDKYTKLGWPCTTTYAPIKEDEQIDIADNTASKQLGVQYRDLETTMLEMAAKMIELGVIEKPAAQ